MIYITSYYVKYGWLNNNEIKKDKKQYLEKTLYKEQIELYIFLFKRFSSFGINKHLHSTLHIG